MDPAMGWDVNGVDEEDLWVSTIIHQNAVEV